MARTKKEKIPELYQIIDENDHPVRIKLGLTCAIMPSRVGKIYQSKAAALTTIRNAIKSKNTEPESRWSYGKVLEIDGLRVSNEEWMQSLLKLKIRIFQPSSTEELTFHLEKIR